MKKTLLACVSVLILSACSENDDNSQNASAILVRTRTDYVGTPDQQVATFTYNGTKLNRISYNSSTYQQFTYSGDLITKMEYYEDGELLVRELLTYNPQGQLIQAIDYEFYPDEPDFDSVTNIVYTYNANGTISTTTYNDESGVEIGATGTLTISNGNIILNNDSSEISTYTFDANNSPYKNITGYSAIVLSALEGGMNNILTASLDHGSGSPETSSFTYTYDNNGYPVTETRTDSEGTFVTHYTY